VAGVRVFDLRIVTDVSSGQIVQKAVHADGRLQKKSKGQVWALGQHEKVSEKFTQTELRSVFGASGAFGMELNQILTQARNYVRNKETGSTEFLILKFDKSTNYKETLYLGGGNLNIKTVDELQGKVIVLFPPTVVDELKGKLTDQRGILGWRNLSAKEGKSRPTYDDRYAGLQYFGKGGTNPFAHRKDPDKKIEENITKQGKLMDTAAKGRKKRSWDLAGLPGRKVRDESSIMPPQVLGMMYWTTTGLTGSIEKRNEKMWTDPNRARLEKLWNDGLGDFVDSRNPLSHDDRNGAKFRNRFMPNIIMIDFANEDYVKTIYNLNSATPEDLEILI
jgi:hypothetical protein